jgi:hypothetical protein
MNLPTIIAVDPTNGDFYIAHSDGPPNQTLLDGFFPGSGPDVRYVGDSGNKEKRVMDRATGKQLSSFGLARQTTLANSRVRTVWRLT